MKAVHPLPLCQIGVSLEYFVSILKLVHLGKGCVFSPALICKEAANLAEGLIPDIEVHAKIPILF